MIVKFIVFIPIRTKIPLQPTRTGNEIVIEVIIIIYRDQMNGFRPGIIAWWGIALFSDISYG